VRPLRIVRAKGPDVVRDVRGEAFRRYGAATVHLVRPDGYLAASGGEAARAYLERVYGAGR
jgi:hypothetical protein